MPRNRMIKPEFCSDGKLGKVSRDAKLLFILMWMHADDYGVISSSERFLLGNCFENDESVTNSMLKEWIDELTTLKFLVKFDSQFKTWYKIKNWSRHQRVDKPSKRRNPVFMEEQPERCDSLPPLDTLNDTLQECLATDSQIPDDEREREREREREKEIEREKEREKPEVPILSYEEFEKKMIIENERREAIRKSNEFTA